MGLWVLWLARGGLRWFQSLRGLHVYGGLDVWELVFVGFYSISGVRGEG